MNAVERIGGRAGFRRWACRSMFLLAVALPLPVSAQPARLHAVKAWRGTFVASASGNTVLSSSGYEARNATETSLSYNGVISVDFILDEFEDEPAVWSGRVVSSNLDATYRSVGEGLGEDGSIVTLDFGTSGPLESDDDRAKLVFHRERGWSFHIGNARRTTELTEVITMKRTGQKFRSRRDVLAYGLRETPTLPYPEKRMILFASGKTELIDFISNAVGFPAAWEYAVYLEPASLEELRLEIEEPTDYATWRPETTPERGPGRALDVTARVVTATGGKPQTRVESFIWDLQGTSTEDGVAMNYPQRAETFDMDLELDAEGPFFVLTQNNQHMERAVRDGFSDSVKVVPFDWGGWSTLHVTAVLADGRRVTGKMKGKSEYGLRVPKRDPQSHIADAWKAQNKSGADDLDDENEPEGDRNTGDGYTLYEEYRGFVIEGEHVGGDPKAKDFFVLNGLGADGETGIALFESLSGFRVHTTTRVEEMDPAKRLMNGNTSGVAHVVDQHGVWIAPAKSASELAGREADSFGALTVATEDRYKKFGFRPGITKGIGILPRGHAESDFSKPFNLGAQDAAATFDRAIAHELMHSVGVNEHGMGDGQIEFSFISPTNRANGVGRPYFAVSDNIGNPVELRNEAGHDLAAAVYVRYATTLAETMNLFRRPFMGDPGDVGYPKMSEIDFQHYCESLIESGFALKGLVGATGGQHSGDQDCIMRYHFAAFYPSTNSAGGYYQIGAGAERLGFGLCRSATGTGVNAPGFSPQSRHGNAAAGAGNCAAQICPNDFVPPQPAPF